MKRVKVGADTILIAVGLTATAVGCSMAWRPLGLIVVGVYLMWVGINHAQKNGVK